MKKILLFSNSLNGLYNFKKELIDELLKNSFKILICSPFDNKLALNYFKKLNIKLLEIDIDRRGKNPLKDLLLLIKFFKILKKEKPNIFLTYTIKPNLYAGLLGRILKLEYILNITGVGTIFQKETKILSLIKKIYKYSLSGAKYTFFQNEENLNYFKSNNLIKSNFKLINGSGVNLSKFNSDILKKDSSILKVMFVGRIMKEKGIDEYLKVAKKIRKEIKNIEFFILGAFEEEEYRNVLNSLEEEGIIKYLGVSSDVREEVKKVHCVVNPSWHEGMSNVLLEAGAMKRFLIASDISGCKEIIKDNITGYLFEKRNIVELELKIRKLLSLTSKEYEEIIERSYCHISKNFDRKEIINEYMKAIKE